MDTKEDNRLPHSPVAKQHRDTDDEVKVESQEHNLQGRIFEIWCKCNNRPPQLVLYLYVNLGISDQIIIQWPLNVSHFRPHDLKRVN